KYPDLAARTGDVDLLLHLPGAGPWRLRLAVRHHRPALPHCRAHSHRSAGRQIHSLRCPRRGRGIPGTPEYAAEPCPANVLQFLFLERERYVVTRPYRVPLRKARILAESFPIVGAD